MIVDRPDVAGDQRGNIRSRIDSCRALEAAAFRDFLNPGKTGPIYKMSMEDATSEAASPG